MKLIPVALMAAACYTAGYIHGEWVGIRSTIYEIKIYETIMDREISPKKFI